MDSLTQMVLGAACGELVAGKKMGNRALAWGALGGTIPDLDVFVGKLFFNEIQAFAFHRGVMHSLFFAVLFPLLFSYPIWKVYDKSWVHERNYKLIFLILWAGVGGYLIFSATNIFAAVLLVGLCIFFLWRFYYSTNKSGTIDKTTYKDWYLLFFLSIFTHPLLDCCTAYGTQLFQPFSDYRVSWNIISVVDPLYTVPFLISLIVVSFSVRISNFRRKWLIFGLSWSVFYLFLTSINYFYVKNTFKKSLDKAGYKYNRLVISPTLLNNFYWRGVAEGDSEYYYAGYSIFDCSDYFENFTVFPKKQNIPPEYANNKDFQVLPWFANGFYIISEINENKYQFSDLRYGMFTDKYTSDDNFIFTFDVEKVNGEIKISEKDTRPKDSKSGMKMLKSIWERAKGRCD